MGAHHHPKTPRSLEFKLWVANAVLAVVGVVILLVVIHHA